MLRTVGLLLVLLGLASASEAQQTRPTDPRPGAALGLRGALSARTAPGPGLPYRQPGGYSAPGAIRSLATAGAGRNAAAQQCRMTCAQTYYFCLANDPDVDCASNWSQCRVSCSRAPESLSY